MYCAWRIPAHLRCTQCSILLHLMDICFLTCICLWQISQIQTCLFKVVGPGFVSTSPVGMQKKHGKSGPHSWGREGSTQFAQQLESAVTAPPLVGCVVWSYGTTVHPRFRRLNPCNSLQKIKYSTRWSELAFELSIYYGIFLHTWWSMQTEVVDPVGRSSFEPLNILHIRSF